MQNAKKKQEQVREKAGALPTSLLVSFLFHKEPTYYRVTFLGATRTPSWSKKDRERDWRWSAELTLYKTH